VPTPIQRKVITFTSYLIIAILFLLKSFVIFGTIFLCIVAWKWNRCCYLILFSFKVKTVLLRQKCSSYIFSNFCSQSFQQMIAPTNFVLHGNEKDCCYICHF